MVQYDQRFFFDSENGEKTLYPGAQSSLIRIEVKSGSCQLFGKLFKQSDPILLSAIEASTYTPTTNLVGSNKLYSAEISGYQELIIKATGTSTISIKLVY